MKPIGLNRLRIGKKSVFTIGNRVDSSFGEVFNNDVPVLVNNGPFSPIQIGIIGNIDELYEIIQQKINETDSIEIKAKKIYEIVTDYFGSFDNVSERSNNYKEDSTEEKGRVSDLKEKNSAMCVERSMVSQNLLKFLGINSYYKTSMIVNNGKTEAHAYNIFEYQGKYYIYDSTMPKLENGEITPIITEIPKEAFDEISKADETVGFPIKVEYYNPIRKEQKSIIYDYWSDKEPYDTSKNQKIENSEIEIE